jgi:hypothetical protein
MIARVLLNKIISPYFNLNLKPFFFLVIAVPGQGPSAK